MSYSILSSNVVLGTNSTPSYSFVTNAGGTLQLECIDSGVTDPQLEVDGSVKCDTVYFTDPTRSRAVASDQFGKLIESTVELDTLQGFDSRITVVEGQTSHLGNLINIVDGNTMIFGNAITANADLSVEGNISCSADLTTEGTVYATGNMQVSEVNASGITITGDLYAVNGRFSGDVFIAASDARLKTDIQVIENASDTIRQIHGYTYRWRDDIPDLPLRGEDCGIIAQEAAATSLGSHLIRPAPFDHTLDGESISGENYMTVRYDRLHALQIQCIHELLDRIDAQDVTIRELQEKLSMR
jgi:hypothetical protein